MDTEQHIAAYRDLLVHHAKRVTEWNRQRARQERLSAQEQKVQLGAAVEEFNRTGDRDELCRRVENISGCRITKRKDMTDANERNEIPDSE